MQNREKADAVTLTKLAGTVVDKIWIEHDRRGRRTVIVFTNGIDFFDLVLDDDGDRYLRSARRK